MGHLGRVTRAGALLVLVTLAGCGGGSMRGAESSRMAWAELKTVEGESVGSGVFWEEDGRVRLVVQAGGLTPGRHGIHVHAVGRCEAPDFQSAGDHFNPLGKKHGLDNPEGAHAGDLPALEADASGRTEYVAVTNRLTLASGAASVFDADGSALVIHAATDDQRTDPSGNSGGRVLCGSIVAGPPNGIRPRP